MPHDANVGDMKLLGGWLEGVVVDFPCLFWGGRGGDRKGCKPRAVLVDTVVVWRIERVKKLIG